jgi:hypothetical protein
MLDTGLLVRVNLAALVPAFDSREEEWWNTHGYLLIGNEFGCDVIKTDYHGLTFHLDGERYTPDFAHVLADGRLVIVEIKAGTPNDNGKLVCKTKNYRDARSKLRAAAERFGWLAVWVEARINVRREWFEIETISRG